ncbi:hypothetical protein BDV11DRAFT_176169, partial [Aspergillus similis]
IDEEYVATKNTWRTQIAEAVWVGRKARINDSVPVSPFNKQRLKIHKFKANDLLVAGTGQQKPLSTHCPIEFPESSVAVIGVSCRFPGANNLEELWELVAKGHDTHQQVPRARIDPTRSFRASADESMAKRIFYGNFLDDVKRFDNSFFGINSKEAASLDPQQRILLELSYEALESSGYIASHVRSAEDPVGCFIGVSLNEYLDNTASHNPSAYTATGTIRAFMCGRLSHYYGWTGPAEVIDTACSSSLVAIHRACRALETGECAMAVAGGVSVLTSMNNYLDLAKAGFLSQTGQCKPFDASADGYCRSEGAGLVVLKKLSDAIRAGNHIFGVIPSIATIQGGTSTTLTVPSASALKALYRRLFERSGLHPSQISYVEAHGTGTQAGDPIEMESVREVMRDPSRLFPLSVGSVKGNFGHCESAAGVAGLLKVLAMMKYGGIPPLASHRSLNPKIPPLKPDGLEITRESKAWDFCQRAALVNSYGAGGSNCALLCYEMPPLKPEQASPPTHRKVSFPVLLSAASKTSLIAHAQDLATHLARNPSQVDVAGVAFTMNQKRKRHRFCYDFLSADLQTLISSLNQVEAPLFQYPQRHKPVVLVLSGQYDNKVALERSIYEAYPAFRSHIQLCESALKQLGYPRLETAIFQEAPIPDPVSLQCSIFAVQYACARCWIDGGLKPDTIIGHSLGEIVALAVSGALSVPDCLKLISHRASLIDTNWGDERGAMLAVHAGPDIVQKLIDWLPKVQESWSSRSSLEIACYNALTSTVIAGTRKSIDLAEHLLSTDKEFAGIRYQRLATTHAFHSRLVESIMPGLHELCHELQWNEPSIPLEFCAPEQLKTIQDWSAARHARDPVYFVNAIQRVEQRLGACIWLEAGFDSPIIPMVRRAVRDSNGHTFPSVSVKQSSGAESSIATAVSDLWRSGLSVSHWSFLAEGRMQFKEAWLPPYHFDRSPCWVENIDRAMEMHEKLLSRPPVLQSSRATVTPPALVSQKESSQGSSNPRITLFSINIQSVRFQKVVTGHAVLKQPLCPAPMYMETAINAIQLLVGDLGKQHFFFEDLQFQSPLGLTRSREVELQLEELQPRQSWKFIVRSASPSFKPNETLVHCLGMATLSQKANLTTYSRLVDSAMAQILDCATTERLMAQRAYALFTKAMHYAPFFKGIRSMAVARNEAVASVRLPEDQPGREESPAWPRCDAVLIDAFISVVGLLLNSSEAAPDDQILIAVGIERVSLTAACLEDTRSDWTVYAKFTSMESTKQLMGGVYILSPDKQVVAMMSGIQFSKLDMVKLTRFLGAANASLSHSHQVSSLPQQKMNVSHSATRSLGIDETPPTSLMATSAAISISSEGDEESESPDVLVKQIILNYTGLDPTDIMDDSILSDLGIDSLSLIEFCEDLNAAFGTGLVSEDIRKMDLRAIIKQLGKRKKGLKSTSLVNGVEAADTAIHGLTSSAGSDTLTNHATKETCTCNPLEALLEIDRHFQEAANRRGYVKYESEVHASQDVLVQAYILEAFHALGVSVLSFSPGSVLPPVPHAPKHDKLVSRLWEILERRGVVSRQTGIILRGRQTPQNASAADLHKDFVSRFPAYLPEAQLMKLTGENMSRCLAGEMDPLSLMFGSTASYKIMEDYYANSPMVSTLTDQLVTFVMILLRGRREIRGGNSREIIRILEVGAGTGATTTRLVQNIAAAGIPCRYMFTDVSARFINKAKEKLKNFPWIEFDTFDLEKKVRPEFRNRFDIVISTKTA